MENGGASVSGRVKNPVVNSIAVVKATAPLSHSKFRPQIERFLECESEAVAFTLSYLQVEKDFLHSLVLASRRHDSIRYPGMDPGAPRLDSLIPGSSVSFSVRISGESLRLSPTATAESNHHEGDCQRDHMTRKGPTDREGWRPGGSARVGPRRGATSPCDKGIADWEQTSRILPLCGELQWESGRLDDSQECIGQVMIAMASGGSGTDHDGGAAETEDNGAGIHVTWARFTDRIFANSRQTPVVVDEMLSEHLVLLAGEFGCRVR